jgi:hypothetical protein
MPIFDYVTYICGPVSSAALEKISKICNDYRDAISDVRIEPDRVSFSGKEEGDMDEYDFYWSPDGRFQCATDCYEFEMAVSLVLIVLSVDVRVIISSTNDNWEEALEAASDLYGVDISGARIEYSTDGGEDYD